MLGCVYDVQTPSDIYCTYFFIDREVVSTFVNKELVVLESVQIVK